MGTVSKFQLKLLNDIAGLLEDSNTCDLVIRVGEQKKEFQAHSGILSARSRYFRTAFSPHWAREHDGKFILEKPNVSPETFEIILKFLYSGRIELNQHEGTEILKLLVAVDELQLDDLLAYIQNYLIEKKTEWICEDPVKILEVVFCHQACDSLRDFCLEKIGEQQSIFKSDGFPSLNEAIIKLVLERDDFGVEEIEIWENLIKWGIAQHSNLADDISRWSKQDFSNVKNTLQQLVPLIRWGFVDSRHFREKVAPYKKIFPKELYENLIDHYLDPNIPIQSTSAQVPRSIISTIVDFKIAAVVIANWIDNLGSNNERRNPYRFVLLFRASRDGFSGVKFHQKCDNKGATVVFAKLKSKEMILGGYNPGDWTNDCQWHHSNRTFLFSVQNSKNIASAQIGLINSYYGRATSHIRTCGPGFGSDFHIDRTDNLYHRPDSYPNVFNIGDENPQKLQEYEVFQVLNK
ncbi:4484_t:CDS:2 [Ambispora gerdemannii]|uniref:4484_t:CDS:1 n=1 Tax=Ambispora gerdemannii TaxID=144530 RepID=A0A9N9A6P7_9GLOM|nr:4484_t:CDS:2 [Ambispora gerdemannii]